MTDEPDDWDEEAMEPLMGDGGCEHTDEWDRLTPIQSMSEAAKRAYRKRTATKDRIGF